MVKTGGESRWRDTLLVCAMSRGWHYKWFNEGAQDYDGDKSNFKA